MDQEKGISPYRGGSDLAQPTSWDLVRTDPQLVAKRLALMISNGRKLQPEEINALGAFALTNDVNPFAGECYYIPGVGPVMGIKALRRKAKENLEREAASAGMPWASSYWFEYREATHEDADFAEGDIAVVATLHTGLDKQVWLNQLIKFDSALRQGGEADSLHKAIEIVGDEPSWTGIGIVRRSERFGAEGRPEMYNREERAYKRAEKAALQKRFSSLSAVRVDVDHEPAIEAQFTREPEGPAATLPDPPRMPDPGPELDDDTLGPEDEPEVPESYVQELADEEAAKDIRGYILDQAESCELPTPRQVQQVAALLGFILGGNERRHEFLSWLVGKEVKSSKDLPDERVLTALYEWLEPKYDEGRHLYYTDNRAAEQAIKDAWEASGQASERFGGQKDLFAGG